MIGRAHRHVSALTGREVKAVEVLQVVFGEILCLCKGVLQVALEGPVGRKGPAGPAGCLIANRGQKAVALIGVTVRVPHVVGGIGDDRGHPIQAKVLLGWDGRWDVAQGVARFGGEPGVRGLLRVEFQESGVQGRKPGHAFAAAIREEGQGQDEDSCENSLV